MASSKNYKDNEEGWRIENLPKSYSTNIIYSTVLSNVDTNSLRVSPQNSYHYKFTGIKYDSVSFKKIEDAKVNLKHAGQILYVNVILNDVKYTATIPTSKLISISKTST